MSGGAGRAPGREAAAAPDEPFFLIGPRGAGKSALGRRLAEHLGWEFADSDALLEARHGRAIAEWLPADPAGFRAAEAGLLEELAGRRALVAALGGGVVERPESVALLAGRPRVVALCAPPAELARRQRGGPRPPLTGLPLEEEVATVLDRRRADYDRAASGRWLDTGGTIAAAWDRLRATAAAL